VEDSDLALATILMVDDDTSLLESAIDILRLSGYETMAAGGGLEALELLKTKRPDIIVADIMMPGMDGYQFYAAVRALPEFVMVPFIFLSAKGEAKDIRHGYSLGADHYLTKPFDPDDLLIAIKSRLQRVKAIQAATRSDVEKYQHTIMTTVGKQLNEPLSYISGYVNLLQEGQHMLDVEMLEVITREMQKGTESLRHLIEDLLLLVYLEGGLGDLELRQRGQPVQLDRHISMALAEKKGKAEEWQIGLSAALEKDLTVLGLGHYLREIFLRLIDNAIQYGRPESRITIRGSRQENEVLVTVEDQGMGIPAERLEQILKGEPLDQDHMGLGLQIALRLIGLHGGSVHVVSVPDQGTTFTVSFPAWIE
jgi:signal transduction histidine kinase